ncbi:MAG TPA: AMP-binding protein [Hanamia sp.]
MKTNLLEYFEQTVYRNKGRSAVIDGDQSISFSELNNKARMLACNIISLKNYTNKPIAVFLPKSIKSVVSDIGITYSGNTYMNIDVKSPKSRIENILKQIGPVLVITDDEHISFLNDLVMSGDILNISTFDFNENFDQESLNAISRRIIDTDPYCIINTSGSTGTPKGVVLNQKSFIDFTEWAIKTLEINDNEIIGSLSPIVFDIYSFELCMLMSKGSTIVLIPEKLSAYPASILNILQVTKVSFIFWVPTIMVNIANMDLLNKIELPDLKTVWFAGEVFPTKQFNYWRKVLKSSKFVNLYGPIEITLDCTYYIAERELQDDEPIPIGFPCRNTDVLILTDDDQSAGEKEEGELCVRGSSLAMGYYNNPQKTSDAFVQNPLNSHYPELIYRTGDIVYKNDFGEILFKGRKDSLVKHLGYRIELGEIEHVVVNTLKLVNNACVVYNKSKKEIALIYEAPSELPVPEFRIALSKEFPKYMIPTAYRHMQVLPRNTNGKIDRLALSKIVNDD